MNNDGRVILELSPDYMLVKATFSPPVNDGRAMTRDDVDYELRNSGVVDGVLWNVVEASLAACNEHAHIVRSVVIARGVRPRPAIPSVLVFPPRLQQLDPIFLPPELQEQNLALSSYFVPAQKRAEKTEASGASGAVDSHGNIDFRETKGVFVIMENQVLAAVRPEIEGLPGRTVRGEYVPFPSLTVNQFTPGNNTELREERLYSKVNGRLMFNNTSFWVDENLELSIDVGYKTGNIRFPGNLILKAGIKDRFKVMVGGNLEANGVIDAYEVVCGKDLLAKAGIIGRGKAMVRCRGSLTTRFIQNVHAESLGPMLIENAALHAHLFTESSITTGDKGKIVGGEAHVLNSMEVFNLGNAAGTHTEIVLGEDYVSHRKLDFARDKYQELMLLVQQLDERLEAHVKGMALEELPQSVQTERGRMFDEAQKYQAMMTQAAEEVRDNPGATLRVKGTIFPGVRVTICGATLEITKELKNSQLSLDSGSKKITISSLTQSKDQAKK